MNYKEAVELKNKLNKTTVYNDCFLIKNSAEYEIYSHSFGKIHINKSEKLFFS